MWAHEQAQTWSVSTATQLNTRVRVICLWLVLRNQEHFRARHWSLRNVLHCVWFRSKIALGTIPAIDGALLVFRTAGK